MFRFKKKLSFLEIKYLLDHELGRRRTFFSPYVTKRSDGIKRLALLDILFNIWISCCQKQPNSPALVRQINSLAGFLTGHWLKFNS